jgi:RimJ/RimL family protein N-acetyltransferase
MKIIKEFTTKSGKKIQLVEPTIDRVDDVTRFANKLAREDTFLSFDPGKELVREDEEKWLQNTIEGLSKGKTFFYFALYENKIVGSVDIHRGHSVRDYHIGTVGLMVDVDFRGEGIGKFLLESILNKAAKEGIRTAVLDCFSNNEKALNLYEKVGFIKYGSLPDGLYRKREFADRVHMYKRLI